MLGTAIFRIRTSSGQLVGPIRAMCDTGSQVNLITDECVRRLKISRKACSDSIIGAGISSRIVANGNIHAEIEHRSDPGPIGNARFSILQKISCHHPQRLIQVEIEQQVPRHQLADPLFRVPGAIDALIGAGTWATLVRGGLLRVNDNECNLTAQNSALGWVISGEISGVSARTSVACHITKSDDSLELDLRQFWEVDDPIVDSGLTPDQQFVEDNFERTHRRDPSGRFHVTIPIRPDASPLGQSRRVALERFLALEAKMDRNPGLAIKCREFMADYLESGDMVLADRAPSDPSQVPYPLSYDTREKVQSGV